jgi:hypothetical protein
MERDLNFIIKLRISPLNPQEGEKKFCDLNN